MPKRSIKALFITLTTLALILMFLGSIWLYNYATDSIAEKLTHTSHEKSDTVRYEMIRFYDQIIYDFLQSESVQATKMAHVKRYFKQHEGKLLHPFLRHLKKMIPTLYSHSVYTVYSSNNEALAVKEIWSQQLSEITKKEVLQTRDGIGNFKKILTRVDPTSEGLFIYPKTFLYPYLNIMFQNNIRKETTYWEDGRYIRIVMLPYQSYYNQLEKSYSFVVLELDETQSYRDARFIKNTMLITWGILVLMVLTMARIFYRRIIAPITLLQSHMQRKTPLQDPIILTKGDEISRISRTYNWLLRDLNNEIQTKQNLLAQFKTFTANAIHQVRTPLSVIKIAHAMIDDNDAHKAAKLHILSSIISMEHLYDSLAFTLHNDTIELPVSTLNLSTILQERVNLFAPVAASLDTAITSTIRHGITVEMNQSELEYLIDNNLSNALKYGQPFKPIILTLSQSPKEFILMFESYGEPIKDTNAIFKRYARQDHSKQGSGIGLHIVATICARYQIVFKVTYEGEKNCFRYFFPIK